MYPQVQRELEEAGPGLTFGSRRRERGGAELFSMELVRVFLRTQSALLAKHLAAPRFIEAGHVLTGVLLLSIQSSLPFFSLWHYYTCFHLHPYAPPLESL